MSPSNTLQKLILMVGCLTAFPSFAQDVAAFGRVEAMGRAGAANPADNTSVTLNPASLGLRKRYELQGYVSITKGPDIGITASVTDSKTSAVALGLTYQRLRYTGGDDSREWPGWVEDTSNYERRKRYDNFTLAVAYPILDNRLSFGLNGTLAKYNHDVQGKGVTGNIDFGISGSPLEFWSLGVVGRNVLPVSGCKRDETHTKPCITDFDSGVLIGTYLGKEEFGAFALDVDIHLTGAENGPPVSVRTGFQKVVQEMVILNAGYRWEGPTQEHWLNFGIGFNQNNAGLHYTLGVPLHPDPWEPLLMTHMLAFRVVSIGSLMGKSPASP